MKKKILIAGGIGFIGYHLCIKLLKKNKVIVVDDLSTANKHNLILLKKYKNFKFIKKNIQNKFSLECDEIYNLACPASPIKYQKNPIDTIKTNIFGTINLLEIAKTNNAKIFQASTSEVYGDPLVHPQKEDYKGNVNTIGIRACYDEGKRLAESIFFDYKRTYNINIKIARIFNTYGPNMNPDDGRVMSSFIIAAIKNEPLKINGNGDQTRSFCYVEDTVNGIIKLMNSNSKICGPVNLGSTKEITMNYLAKKIISKTSSDSKIIHLNKVADDPIKRKPSIKLAKELLKWENQTSLDEGIKKTIKYFKNI
jgi:UDP-glucuronate decarboxylase